MTAPTLTPTRVLFIVDGFTDIRFVVGLSEVANLTMVVPEIAYRSSGLDRRVEDSGASLKVIPISGGRAGFQVRSMNYLVRHAHKYDVILAQEVTRGALNANLIGWLVGVPVLNTLAMPPVEYFRCRRDRGTIGWFAYRAGDAAIRGLMALNGRLASGWLALGPYLERVALRHTRRLARWGYYGVDTTHFCPADPEVRAALRRRHKLPQDAFLILLASRVSHEKDPETALAATHLVRQSGVDAVILNLGGGYRDFLDLASRMGLPNPTAWVIGRPAAHPMGELADYFRAADLLVQSSLEEGLGLSPLEALACGTPVVATAVGGMAVQLAGRADLVPRRDAEAMAIAIRTAAADPAAARSKAIRARLDYVVPVWDRAKVFQDLTQTLRMAASVGRLSIC